MGWSGRSVGRDRFSRGHTLDTVSGGGTTDPPPKLRSKTPVIAAQVGATLTVTVALSFLGVAGTMAGLVAGTLISQVSAFFYEQWVVRAHARARRHVAQYRARRVPGQADGWDDYYRPPASSRRVSVPYRAMAATGIIVLALSAATIIVVELAAAKPLSAVVTRSAGSGTSFTGGTVDHDPAGLVPSPSRSATSRASVSPVASPVTQSPSAAASPIVAVTVTPSPAPSSPLPSSPALISP